MKLKFNLIKILTMLFLVACNNEDKSFNFNNREFVKYDHHDSFESFVEKIQVHYQLPGIGVALIKNDSVLYSSVQGHNKTTNGSILDTTSLFQICSVTKSFTALLTSTFVSDTILRWDSTIEEIFPINNIHEDFKNTTIIELLSHTSGLREYATDQEVFSVEWVVPNLKGSVVDKRRQFSLWNLSQPATFIKGNHHYSNAGYVIVASILEKLSNKSYESLIQERIFDPLNLNSAVFGYPFLKDEQQPHRHMHRNFNGIGIPMNHDERIPASLFNPAGFISLTISDLANYVIENKKIITRQSSIFNNIVAQELFIPHVTLSNGYSIGLGWQIIPINEIQTFGHTGSDQSVRAGIAINPSNDSAVVFATNIGDEISEIALVNVIVEIINR